MYGQIHLCVKSLVVKKFGADVWAKIAEASEADETEHFLVFHRYPDSFSINMIGKVCDVLGVDMNTVLEIFGEYFLQYCMECGYDKMLHTLGGDFFSFIQNLDSLHALLSMTYTQLNAPSFRCVQCPNGDVELHYYSPRLGLYPICLGLVRAVGRELYHLDAAVNLTDVIKEDMGDGIIQEHAVFTVKLGKAEKTRCDLPTSFDIEHCIGSTNFVSQQTFCDVFPFHVLFDENMVILQVGVNVYRMSYSSIRPGQIFNKVFHIEHPHIPFTIEFIEHFIQANYIIQMNEEIECEGKKYKTKSLSMKGQILRMTDNKHFLFIGSPRLSSLNAMLEMKMFISDIPIYDVTRELVLLNQQRIAEIEISKKLDETTAELKRTGLALEKEQAKTEMLLNQMLPKKVAEALKRGEQVEAEKFAQVTILFSDIVTFTNIAAAVTPIDIVNMLNNMYSRFDNLSELHDVYKVETIGDAYMVVSGVPEVNTDHARKVANFSIDMVNNARQVCSPATGKPLQIRVGFHSGPVVAGVVGAKMPRYCLFGDTVNTSSRMESHGVPGRVHLSPFAYNHIKDYKEYLIQPRGEMQVKGKGKMKTYFLLGRDMKDKTNVVFGEDERIAKYREGTLSEWNAETGPGGPGDSAPTKSNVCRIL